MLALEDDVAKLMATTVERFGRLDALYNNAAGARLGTALDMSKEDAEFTLRGVLEIPWLVTRHAVPYLAKPFWLVKKALIAQQQGPHSRSFRHATAAGHFRLFLRLVDR